jgi:DNA-binding beta-propeller fold protein YncE
VKIPSSLVCTAGCLCLAGLLISQPDPVERVGPRPDGSVLLNSGWILRPAGRQVPLSTFPMASALTPDGKRMVVLEGGYMPPSVALLDAATMDVLHRLPVADGWLGVAFAPKSNVFYVGGGSRSAAFEFAVTAEGKIEARREIQLVPAASRKPTDFIGDVAVSPDGRMLYAAALYRDSIFVVNLQTGIVIEEWKTGPRPYRILPLPDGKSLLVTSWVDGSIHQHSAANGERIVRTPVGMAPMDMVLSTRKPEAAEGEQAAPADTRLFVAVSNTNTVAVFAVGSGGRLTRLESINVGLFANQPAGVTPSALALSPDETHLYVVCSDTNSVAQVDVSAVRSRVEGFIPTGWYPTAARVLPGGTLVVLNGRGSRSFPNPKGPVPTVRAAPVHEGNAAVEYVGAIQRGSASVIEPPSEGDLLRYTSAVQNASPYGRANRADSAIPPESLFRAAKMPIEHVIYVVKENRTYDQVLGDLGSGNGDPSLTLFGENVSPNHHKLARDFVLLDNFYVSADVSADGHNWSAAAIAPAYVQRFWPNSYAARRRFYDYEGTERAALPPAGYIWSNALAKGLTLRNYGWWVNLITPAPASGPQIASARDTQLAAHTNFDYRGFDLEYRDTDRVQVFLKDLKQFEDSGQMPALITMRLGNDHTSGVSPKKIAPLSAMADNDAAFGQLVEAVSRSRFWSTTAIFVLEDDAQNGPDHVDSHRSPAFILSPYTRGRGIDSTMYNTVSMLRTIEMILGMAPMTMHDAGARLMWAAFSARPDTRPWSAEAARIPLDTRNPENTPLALRSRALELDEADEIDEDLMNDVLWRAIRGGEPPAPVRSLWGN